MHDLTKWERPKAKSYSRLYDLTVTQQLNKIFSIYNYIMPMDDVLRLQSQTGDYDEKDIVSNNNSKMLNETPYVTSERYHSLNKKSSDKSVLRSTSTFFYDLDTLAKRHSYHCVTNLSKSKKSTKDDDNIKNGFGVKSEAIVQECATQMKPKLLAERNVKENKKKLRKTFPDDSYLSSEIFLRDDGTFSSYKNGSHQNLSNEKNQKFWSFAKYRTEYTNPVAEEKMPKKDRGKRTEDPCPCQLFSYACPCTNKKSLTELAKNSKSLTVADQNTSTTQDSTLVEEQKCNMHNKVKKKKTIKGSDDKRTSTLDVIESKSKELLSNVSHTLNINNNLLRKTSDKVISNATNINSTRKLYQVICPNCKEIVVVKSTSEEEEESLKSKSSPHYQNNALSAAATYAYQDNKSKIVESKDICNHDPQCELVPICQILPTDNCYVNPNIANKQSTLKPNARVIRVTKGCRHHPPCTVVPSCQRVNVLNNNCEYIPPCLHRPRCVNLPLCAPLSKTIYYEESINKAEQNLGTTECLHLQQNRYKPTNQFVLPETQINSVLNTCEYLSECSPRYVLNSTLGCTSPIASACKPGSLCNQCKTDKSCQFDFLDWKQHFKPDKETLINDDVIFIRDVGCQFRNKNFTPKESVAHSKVGNSSVNSIDMKVGKYCSNFRTLRYEDKATIPQFEEELSISTVTFSSTELDSQCPTHGKHQNRDNLKGLPTGFVPHSNISPYVGNAQNDPVANFCFSANGNFRKKIESSASSNVSIIISKNRLSKSRSSFLQGKCKKIFPIRKRRKSRYKLSYQYR